MNVWIRDIVWDTDGEEVDDLPQNVQAKFSEDVDDDGILDWLSNEYGLCVNSCVINRETRELGIITVDKLIEEMMKLLPNIEDMETTERYRNTGFLTDSSRMEILSARKENIEVLANFLDQLYEEPYCTTGYYDPEEDKRNNETDVYTGMYYLSIA